MLVIVPAMDPKMRALLLVILGLVVGAMGSTFALSALRQATPFDKGVMTVMQHHVSALREEVRARQCDAKASAVHLARLSQAAADIHDAFPGMDAGFATANGKLGAATDAAVAAAPADCPGLAAALKPVGDACQACHQQYR